MLAVPMLKKTVCLLVAGFLAGCSTYSDRTLSTTTLGAGILDGGVSYFCQDASYATQESVHKGAAVLSQLLGFWPARHVALVRFTPLSRDAFSVDYLDRNLDVLETRRYDAGDYDMEGDGAISIQTVSRCSGGGGPGVGCSRETIRLFIDKAGNLAVIQTAGGAGIVGVVPVAVSATYLSIFPAVLRTHATLQEGLAQCPESRAARIAAERKRQNVVPTFAVGDVVIPYRHYDPATNRFLPGAAARFAGTKWRVKAITHRHVRLELIEGEYKAVAPVGAVYRAGEFESEFDSSRRYKAANPYAGSLGQLFEEYRKDN